MPLANDLRHSKAPTHRQAIQQDQPDFWPAIHGSENGNAVKAAPSMMNVILGDGMEEPGGGSPVEDKLKVDVGAVRCMPIHADTKKPTPFGESGLTTGRRI